MEDNKNTDINRNDNVGFPLFSGEHKYSSENKMNLSDHLYVDKKLFSGTNMKENTYIKVDNNKIINESCIRWIKKMDECLEICIKVHGCHGNLIDTHKICKINNYDSYTKLNKSFE